MSLKTTWIVISDASRAFVYKAREKNQPWMLLAQLEHPLSREKNQDLVSDRPGRVQQSPGLTGDGKGSRSGVEASITPKQSEHLHFAQEVAGFLEKGLNDQAYQDVVLVANPHFLGLLREKLPEGVKKRVMADVAKNYTHLSEPELRKQLDEVWAYV